LDQRCPGGYFRCSLSPYQSIASDIGHNLSAGRLTSHGERLLFLVASLADPYLQRRQNPDGTNTTAVTRTLYLFFCNLQTALPLFLSIRDDTHVYMLKRQTNCFRLSWLARRRKRRPHGRGKHTRFQFQSYMFLGFHQW
jgi:hypothetical protein